MTFNSRPEDRETYTVTIVTSVPWDMGTSTASSFDAVWEKLFFYFFLELCQNFPNFLNRERVERPFLWRDIVPRLSAPWFILPGTCVTFSERRLFWAHTRMSFASMQIHFETRSPWWFMYDTTDLLSERTSTWCPLLEASVVTTFLLCAVSKIKPCFSQKGSPSNGPGLIHRPKSPLRGGNAPPILADYRIAIGSRTTAVYLFVFFNPTRTNRHTVMTN